MLEASDRRLDLGRTDFLKVFALGQAIA